MSKKWINKSEKLEGLNSKRGVNNNAQRSRRSWFASQVTRPTELVCIISSAVAAYLLLRTSFWAIWWVPTRRYILPEKEKKKSSFDTSYWVIQRFDNLQIFFNIGQIIKLLLIHINQQIAIIILSVLYFFLSSAKFSL